MIFGMLLLISRFIHSHGQGEPFSAQKMKEVVEDLVSSGLGMEIFHNNVRKFTTIENLPVDATKVVKEIKQDLETKLAARIEQLSQLVKYVQDSYNTFSSEAAYPKCCENSYADDKFDIERRIKVNEDELCYSLPPGSPKRSPQLPPASILNILQKIAQSAEDVQSVYLATEEGTMFNYPSFESEGFPCRGFDPRLRPYYIGAATNNPKDIVILVDWTSKTEAAKVGSRSMFDVAIDLIRNILGGFNDRDRVVLIPFGEQLMERSDDVHIPHTCFLHDFEQLSDRRKLDIEIYLGALKPSNDLSVIPISTQFEVAFDHLQGLTNPDRETAVIFISGVLPDEEEGLVYQGIEDLSDRAVSHTVLFYQLGNDPRVTTLFTEMKSRLKARSVLEVFGDPFDLHVIMHKYFNPNRNNPQISPPFIDASTKALTQAISLPIYISNSKELYGIAVMDVSVKNFYKELYDFKAGRYSYLFAYDSTDDSCLFHPLLPTQKDDVTPPYIPIEFLENTDNFPSLTEETNTKYIPNMNRVLAKGDPHNYGVILEPMSASYTCSLVATSVPTFKLVVCLVLQENYEILVRTVSRELKQTGQRLAFFYHRFDFELQQGGPICRSFNRQTFKNKTSVKLAAKAFKYPINYLRFAETEEDIQKYINAVSTGESTDIFHEGAIEDILVTSIVNDMWLVGNLKYDLVTHAVWRYIGTKLGIHRVQPAVMMDKAFDPTHRLWYTKAIGLRGATIITTPYLDQFGAGHIVSVARAVYERDGKVAFGVMAIDITIQYLYLLLETAFEQDCAEPGFECFLMDDGGYIITHKSWVVTSQTGEIPVERVHIAELEPVIAATMLSKGYLIRTSCMDMFYFTEHFYYRVNIPTTGVQHELGGNVAYRAAHAHGTNVYIVQKSLTTQQHNPRCSCDNIECKLPLNECECPCHKPPSSTHCITSLRDIFPCTPIPDEPLFIVDTPEQPYAASKVNYKDREFCILEKCDDKSDLEGCQVINHCRWCTHDKSGNILDEPFCGQYDECWFGQVGRALYTDDLTEEAGIPPAVIAGVGGGLFLTLFLIVVFIIRRAGREEEMSIEGLEETDEARELSQGEESEKSQSGQSQSDKSQDEKSRSENSQSEKSQSGKSQDEKSQGEKSQGEKSVDEKSQGEKSLPESGKTHVSRRNTSTQSSQDHVSASKRSIVSFHPKEPSIKSSSTELLSLEIGMPSRESIVVVHSRASILKRGSYQKEVPKEAKPPQKKDAAISTRDGSMITDDEDYVTITSRDLDDGSSHGVDLLPVMAQQQTQTAPEKPQLEMTRQETQTMTAPQEPQVVMIQHQPQLVMSFNEGASQPQTFGSMVVHQPKPVKPAKKTDSQKSLKKRVSSLLSTSRSSSGESLREKAKQLLSDTDVSKTKKK